MPAFKGARGMMIDRPPLASDIYADKAPKPERRRKFFHCIDCGAIVAPLVKRCDSCYAMKRRELTAAFKNGRKRTPTRIVGEAHAQLTGRNNLTIRCSDCRLPESHCKCNAPIERAREGRRWY